MQQRVRELAPLARWHGGQRRVNESHGVREAAGQNVEELRAAGEALAQDVRLRALNAGMALLDRRAAARVREGRE